MGFFTEFDHHAVAADLDAVGWDSYPLGFLDSFPFCEADKLAYARQGHPDIAAFHHDLYRGCTKGGRWWVLEQQPGPVNWARHNPAPLPGMVRLWTLEAMAHGAELVSYFRWRQFPRAQEQHHAGLLRPDDCAAPGLDEARQAAADIAALGAVGPPPRSVALVFAYDADWVTGIQPQGGGLSALWAAFNCYSALRRMGLDVDIVAPSADLAGYALCVVPCLPIVSDVLVQSLSRFAGQIVIGPRTCSRDPEFAIPPELPPGPLQQLLALKVVKVESLRPGLTHPADGWNAARWLEHVEGEAEPELTTADGTIALWRHGNARYLASWPEPELAGEAMRIAARYAELPVLDLPPGLRVRRAGRLCFAFNYSTEPCELPARLEGEPVFGSRRMAPAEVTVLEL
jgi:beta-galactosidase